MPALFAVGLVAHEGKDEEGVAAVIAGVFDPFGYAVKTGAICQVETHQAAVCVAVVPVEEEGMEEARMSAGGEKRRRHDDNSV